MRAAVYCFSGTGNTRLLSEGLAEKLRAAGVETDVFSIRAGVTLPSPAEYDRIIVSYPVHAFNAPKPVLDFLKELPEGKRFVPVYLLRTSGEPLKLNRASGTLPKRILGKKGYFLRGEFHYVMPYNIIFKHSEGMAVRMKETAQSRLSADAKCVLAGKECLEKASLFSRTVSFVLRIEHVAMPVLGRTFRTGKECTGCGLCVKNCPQGNIKLVGGKPEFGKKCVGCMACAFGCPHDAVRISVLNGWRVNGGYSFEGPPASDREVCRYCRKSYLEYFHRFRH